MKRFLLLALCTLVACDAGARTLYVDARRPNNNGNGLSVSTAKKTLQAAINVAQDGDTIVVYPGTYAPIATHGRKIAIRYLSALKTIVRGPLELDLASGQSQTIPFEVYQLLKDMPLYCFDPDAGIEGYDFNGDGAPDAALSLCDEPDEYGSLAYSVRLLDDAVGKLAEDHVVIILSSKYSTVVFRLVAPPVADAITLKGTTVAYGDSATLVATVSDQYGKPFANQTVKISINGKSYPRTTDSKGTATLPLPSLVPGTYTATAVCEEATATAKVVVKRGPAKLIAKKKAFKAKKKVKKYVVTLRTSSQPVKKAKVTLKVKDKTYTAKTNAKGKATFKLKKLTKKGTYKATVMFKGNKYYKKAKSKKVKIKVK